jgi:SAM-dependent methyltransferase
LSRRRDHGTSAPVTPPAIFDRSARRIRRDATAGAPEAFFTGLMIDELLDRLDVIKRRFGNVLVIGAEPRLIDGLKAGGATVSVRDPAPRKALACGGIGAEEDDGGLPLAAYDLVVAIGTLDTVDDLPGALALMRRALKPDGAFLAVCAGAGALPAFRNAVIAADAAKGQAVARFHPQIDVRAAGDLLVRAGFALPVADVARFDLSYASVDRLLADLRAAAMRNVLAQRHAVTRRWRNALSTAFTDTAEPDGRTRETMSLIVLTAWAPAPDQPQPARRGSAVASLADALKHRGQ